MKIAAAQTEPTDGNIEYNLQEHYTLAKLASEKGAELVIFPEMSLTGYQLEHAGRLAFVENDARLGKLRELAVTGHITIVAGAPFIAGSGLHIASFIIRPGHEPGIYTKRFLHKGEEKFFSPSHDHNPSFQLGSEKLSFAICADITNPQHPQDAASVSASLYLASIFYTPKGIAEGHQHLGSYAKTYGMNVLMANYGGPSYSSESAGRSAFWTADGTLLTQLHEKGSGLLIVEKHAEGWRVC